MKFIGSKQAKDRGSVKDNIFYTEGETHLLLGLCLVCSDPEPSKQLFMYYAIAIITINPTDNPGQSSSYWNTQQLWVNKLLRNICKQVSPNHYHIWTILLIHYSQSTWIRIINGYIIMLILNPFHLLNHNPSQFPNTTLCIETAALTLILC